MIVKSIYQRQHVILYVIIIILTCKINEFCARHDVNFQYGAFCLLNLITYTEVIIDFSEFDDVVYKLHHQSNGNLFYIKGQCCIFLFSGTHCPISHIRTHVYNMFPLTSLCFMFLYHKSGLYERHLTALVCVCEVW